MKVKLVSYSTPTEEFLNEGIDNAQELVAFCARVSNPSNQLNTETSEKLIKYLIKNAHWSPLEMVSACLEIETTRDISMLNIAMKMFFVVTVPVIFGMIVRSLMTNFIISKTLIIQRLSIILFLIVFIAIWVEEWDRIVSYIIRAGLIAFILNMTMIFVGYYVAKFWTSGIAQRKCISLECGLQNGTLAVFVTTQLFDDIVFMVPTAAYALIMFCTSIIFVLIVRKIN